MIGQTISHYRIIEKLGEGGMGVVYKAHDTTLDRTVALKFLPHYLTTDQAEKERFYHEARAAAALTHQNIAVVYEIGEYEGPASAGAPAGKQIFIAMEYVEGKTLKEIVGVISAKDRADLRHESPLPMKKILDIAIQICDGLAAAHEKGIVHRDIKSDNIIVTLKGQAKITDFGLAKLKGATKLTKAGSTLGTAAYMSPEQARGEDVDHRSDIFSLGAVLYEIITGQRPFKGEHEAAIMYSLMNEIPEPLARYKSNIPDELQRIVDKALAKNKGERYQHVDEMVSDLRRVEHTISGTVASKIKKSKAPWVIAAVAVVLVAIIIYLFYPKPGVASANSKTIAVLPFSNLSEDKGDEYFSDGITEDILTQLSKIADLSVISRTTMMQYKGTKKSLKEIGGELKAGVILEGSVRRSGDRVRISSQLIDAATDKHIWADNYDREMKDVFAIQSDVAKQIAAALKAKFSSSEKERIEKIQTESTEAYQLYLKGRFYWNKRTVPDLRKSIEYFNQAIEKDPSYALAYAGLASSHVIIPAFGFSAMESYQKAQQAATRALEFDSTLAEAHTVLGHIKENRYDWTNAENEYRQAIELNPSYPTAHQWYSGLLSTLGRFDEAITEAMRATELDPLSLIINYNLCMTHFYMRHYDQAMDQCNKGIELDPNFPWSYYARAVVAEVQGRFDEAIKDNQKVRMLAHNDPLTPGDLGRCYARIGRKDEALEALRKLREYANQGYSVSFAFANIYYGLGDRERTFEMMEKSIRDQEGWILDANSNPLYDSLRSDPRFIALMKKVGLGK